MLEDALRTWRGADYPVGIGYALSNLGRAATRVGELEQAGERLREARERFAALGAGALELETQAREAERLVAARHPEQALSLVGGIRRSAKEHGAPPALLSMLQRLAGWSKAQFGQDESPRWR